jgi:hypothetical protein
LDNGLNGTSIGKPDDHDDDQFASAAQSFHHGAWSGTKGLLTGAAADTNECECCPLRFGLLQNKLDQDIGYVCLQSPFAE